MVNLGTALLLVLAGLWGALWGSFFNVAVLRFPWEEESVAHPPSHCTSCGKGISWYDNIPILSWLVLGGKCRHCKVAISGQYVLVEIFAALFAVGIMWRLGPKPGAFAVGGTLWAQLLVAPLLYFAIGGLLIVAGLIDLRTQILPDSLTLSGTLLALLTSWWLGYPGLLPAALGAAAGAGVVLLFHYGWKWLRGFEGMGLGDAKLMLVIGAWLGLPGVLFAFFAGSVQGIVAWIFFRSRLEEESTDEEKERAPTQVPIPFGPFLALAALEFAVFGDWILALAERFLFAGVAI